MTDIVAAANYVKSIVEAEEEKERAKFEWLTQAELNRLPQYQSSLPTSPSIGFRYRKKFWRNPKDGLTWSGPWEHLIGRDLPKDVDSWPVVWMVYTVIHDPDNSKFALHVPKEAKVIEG